MSCLLRFRNQAFFCLGNGGGRTLTSNFLAQRLPGTLIYWPFDKPDGWQECRCGEGLQDCAAPGVPGASQALKLRRDASAAAMQVQAGALPWRSG